MSSLMYAAFLLVVLTLFVNMAGGGRSPLYAKENCWNSVNLKHLTMAALALDNLCPHLFRSEFSRLRRSFSLEQIPELHLRRACASHARSSLFDRLSCLEERPAALEFERFHRASTGCGNDGWWLWQRGGWHIPYGRHCARAGYAVRHSFRHLYQRVRPLFTAFECRPLSSPSS